VLLSIFQLYLNQWLQIRWRKWMTAKYLDGWLHNANHYRMQLKGEDADNPDQRLADDVKLFVNQTLGISTGLLNSIVSLASFVIILWGLSEATPLLLFGSELHIPGYLVWGALIYSVLGTVLTQWIGAPLVRLNFLQQHYEADYRFDLVRVRENSEQIALLKGEPTERERLLGRFGWIVGNWYAIMRRTMFLTAFTSSFAQAAVVFPFILGAPAYFANKILLGALLQTAEAFGKVQDALSFFVSAYRSLAEWRAVIERLDGFETSIEHATNLAVQPPKIDVAAADGEAIELAQLLVKLPNGKPLVTADRLRIRNGEHVLVNGPSGAGKSTLFRAIAGIWPFGHGVITIPANAKLMMLPQRPYFPIGTLKAAIAYPSKADAFSPALLEQTLAAVGLPQFASRLDEEAHWNRMLSLGEQQRLGIARALLQEPQYLFLDEATASLDEPSEAVLYRLLAERLKGTTTVSIGHRSTLEAFHDNHVVLEREGEQFAARSR
jgi:vitamin B12/bleomycin/antimicrobial peptide transport system ATP-binding/permease protein